MRIRLDEAALRRELAGRLEDPEFRLGLRSLAADPFFVAFFLMSVSQGEGLGEAAVGMIGQEEVAGLIHDLRRQELEERGHKEQTRAVARELFPETFVGDRYRYPDALEGRPYYLSVLAMNREQLSREGRLSRLNQYLTTTFGYEVMVVLLYDAVAREIERSPTLPAETRERVVAVLDRILAEEETHLGVLEQHEALCSASRKGLSAEARLLLEALEGLTAVDYRFAARLSVDEVVEMMKGYAHPPTCRGRIEAFDLAAGAAGRS